MMPKVGDILVWYGKPVGKIIQITSNQDDNVVYIVRKK